MSFFVIRDKRTHGFFIKLDNDGVSYWSESPFVAKRFGTEEDALDYYARYLARENECLVCEMGGKLNETL